MANNKKHNYNYSSTLSNISHALNNHSNASINSIQSTNSTNSLNSNSIYSLNSGSSLQSQSQSSSRRSNSVAVVKSPSPRISSSESFYVSLQNTVSHGTNYDVYVMAKDNQSQAAAPPPSLLNVPVDVDPFHIESADEYDTEYHEQDDEDVIIQRVMGKFDEQEKHKSHIITKTPPFSEKMKFWKEKVNDSPKKKKNLRRTASLAVSGFNKSKSNPSTHKRTKTRARYSKYKHKHKRTITPMDNFIFNTSNFIDTNDIEFNNYGFGLPNIDNSFAHTTPSKSKKSHKSQSYKSTMSSNASFSASLTPEPTPMVAPICINAPKLMQTPSADDDNVQTTYKTNVPIMMDDDDDDDIDDFHHNNDNGTIIIDDIMIDDIMIDNMNDNSSSSSNNDDDDNNVNNNDNIPDNNVNIGTPLTTLNETDNEEMDSNGDNSGSAGFDDDNSNSNNSVDDSESEEAEISFFELPTLPNRSNRRKHNRLNTAPVIFGNASKNNDHVYKTWNYEDEMDDTSIDDDDFDADADDDDDDDDIIDTNSDDDDNDNDDVKYGTADMFLTFCGELSTTSNSASFLFESLLELCTKLKSSFSLKHSINYDWTLLKYDKIDNFLKLLGYTRNDTLSQWILNKKSIACINYGLSSCKLQLNEISKQKEKRNTLQQQPKLTRPSTVPLQTSTTPTAPTPPIPPIASLSPLSKSVTILEEKINNKQNNEIDCQLYELIWSMTHNHTDNNVNNYQIKEIILLSHKLMITSIGFFKLLELRFFNDDYGRTSYSTSNSNSSDKSSPLSTTTPSVLSSSPSNTSTTGNTMPTLPALPSLTPTFCVNNTSNTAAGGIILDDNQQIKSSYYIQTKIVEVICFWIQTYWNEDWKENDSKLLIYLNEFIEKCRQGYTNDIDFDDNEKQKGLQLINTINATIQIQNNKKDNSANNNNNKCNHLFEQKIGKMGKLSKKKKNKRDSHKRRRSFLSQRLSTSSINIYALNNNNIYLSLSDIPNDLLKLQNNALISNQLSLYLYKIYSSITSRECLYQHKINKMKLPNLEIYKNTFNNIVKWVQSSILLQSDASKRAKIIKKWIKICDLLFELRNFQGFVAVQCAIVSNPIYTLKDAWNQNNILKRKHHTKVKEFNVIMSASRNFMNLRNIQNKANSPLIPYFGIFAKDLIYIQQGISKYNNINWWKLTQLYKIINKHLIHQKISYNNIINEHHILQKWLTIQLNTSGRLKTEHLEKMSKDVAQSDKKLILSSRHHKSFSVAVHR